MKNRIKFIDIARAFAIIIIVIGHTIVHSEHCHAIFKFIYSFNIPLFFILSGLTFNVKDNFSNFIRKKIKRIIIPYFIWEVIFLIPYLIFGENIANSIQVSSSYNVIEQLFNILYGIGYNSALKQNTALWFLPALFSTEIIFYFIIKVLNDNKRNYVIAFIIILLINIITSKYLKVYLPWGINTALNIGIFFFYGYCLKKFDCIFKKYLNFKSIIIFFIIGNLANYFNHTISYLDYNYENSILCLLTGFCFSNILIFISKVINENKILEYIGKNSMGILIFHKITILVFQTKIKFISRLLINSSLLTELSIGLVVSIISIIFSLIINRIIKKIMPILIGEK